MFVNTSLQQEAKLSALGQHQSQASRIDIRAVDDLRNHFSIATGLPHPEAFEVLVQVGGDSGLQLIETINDCPFSRFWSPLIKDQPLMVIHAEPVQRAVKAMAMVN